MIRCVMCSLLVDGTVNGVCEDCRRPLTPDELTAFEFESSEHGDYDYVAEDEDWNADEDESWNDEMFWDPDLGEFV